MTNKLICLVGLCGAGKTEVANYMMKKRKFGYLRFGQITMDKIKAMGKQPSEVLERKIREDLRKKYGMAAYALLNLPKFDKLLKKSNVIGDGLYSWEEYLELKKKYKDCLVIVAIYSPPTIRYQRLAGRAKQHGKDEKMRFRSFVRSEAIARDKAEIENLHKAGPIAMADYTLINTSSIKNLQEQIDTVLKDIFEK